MEMAFSNSQIHCGTEGTMGHVGPQTYSSSSPRWIDLFQPTTE